jgi:hypothetical protein
VDVGKGRDISTLRFNWRTEVGAAVFRGRGQIWVVFDAPARIELASLRVNGARSTGGSAVLAPWCARHDLYVRAGVLRWHGLIIEILDAHPVG